MMRFGAAALAGLLLVGCGGGPGNVALDGVYVSGVSALQGGSELAVFPNDVVRQTTWPAGGAAPVITEQTVPGVFGTVRAVARQELSGVRAVTADTCLDYGTDSVRIIEGGQVVAEIAASCPDDAVIRVQRLVRAAVANDGS